MKVLIVEDETAAYENLTDILTEITPDIRIMANTESVTQTVGWLQSNPASGSDIHGYSFIGRIGFCYFRQNRTGDSHHIHNRL